MELDQKALDFFDQAKKDGFSFDDIVTVLKEQGYELGENEQSQKEESPGVIEGTGMTASNALAFGQGSRIAGLMNTGIGKLVGALATPLGQKNLLSIKTEELDPSLYKEQYQAGKQKFQKQLETFEDEHPVASTIGEVGGTLAGIAIPAGAVGGLAKAGVAATRLGKAGKIGQVASRLAGEATAFGTYEGIREGFGEGRADAIEALKGAGKGAALGGALGILGGAVQATEPTLVEKAVELGLSPRKSKLLVKALGIGAEGTTLGAVPAALEGRSPTAKDIETGLAFAAGGRVASEAISAGLGRARKWITEPTTREIQIQEGRGIQESLSRKEMRLKQLEKEGNKLGAEKMKGRIGEQKVELEEFIGKDEELRAEITGDKDVNVKISPSEEQIKSYMKDDKNLTREQAVRLATEANKEGALVRKKQPLTFRQRARNAIESIRETFNVARPLEKAEEDALRVTGESVPMDKRASVMAAKLQNGGEWQAMSEPVATVLERELKVSPKVAEKYRVYAQAKKNLQFKQQRGEAISAKDLADVKMFENDKGVQAIDREVKKLNQDVLKGLYDSGRIDKVAYDKWKANDSYVPSKAVMDYVDENPVISRELESFTKRYEGTGLVYENSILSSLKQGQALHRFSELNKIKQQFVDSARKIGDATLQTANENYAGGKVNFNRKNQIVVWRDGKPQVWNVSEKVANYFNPKPQEPVGSFMKALGAMMRLYKGGTTATSLGFSYSNIFRDVQGAVFGSKYGGYIGSESIRNSAKELMENTKLAQFFRKEYGGKTILRTEQLPELSKDSVKDAANALASVEKAYPEGSQRNILARMFTTVAPEYAGKVMNVSSKATKGALEGLTYAGQLGEETTRFSVFKSVLEAKAKNQAQLDLWLREPNKIPKNVLAEAGNEAREVTLNFNKQMAPWVEKANRYMLPYFKPSILGAMRGFEVLTNPEIAPRAWRYIINLGVLQGLINGRMGTKEQLEKYEAVNNEIAGKNFVLQGKDGKVYSLPLSQEFGPLTKLFGLATEKLYRNTPEQAREDIGREALNAAKQEAENLIPVAGYLTNPSNLTIQPFKLPLELSINKDLYSKVPIEPEYLRALPRSMRYNQNTSRTLVKLAEVASKLGVEISPLQMQHIVKGTVSSTGKEALALSDNILATLLSTDLRPRQEMQNNPLIRRFMVDMYAPYNQYSLDAREIIEDNKEGYNALEKGKIDPESYRGKRYTEQYYVYDTIKPYADELNKLYKERKELLEDLRQIGEYNRAKYEKGDWSKDKLLYENDKAMKEAEGALTYYKDYQRQLEMSIIRDAKEAKKEYNKSPR